MARAILLQATSGRPLVLSRGIGDTWTLQCNGFHFIQDPADKQEVAVVEKSLSELDDAGYVQAAPWQGDNRHIYLTPKGKIFVDKALEFPDNQQQ